ncbi:uncharacterized protein [Apostichopus japonicus]|uniref:uncharacterized protein isoform X2 n=1 Tax=Stichopus japonicus TaxID=307972 RepID=UPI003AB5EE13
MLVVTKQPFTSSSGPGKKIMMLDTLGEEEESSDESLDEEVDFKPPQVDNNKFEMLCDGLLSAMSLLQSSLAEFLLLKDELVQHALPPSLLARTAMVSGRIFRSATDLHTPATELIRLVRVYSTSWEEKSAALKKLHSDYDSKHKQLNIAVRRLQLIDAQARRMAKERRIMMWEKLFSKLTSARGHGRRWKFLIDNFKQKTKLGMEHLQAYIDSLDKEPESEEDEGEEEKREDLLSQSNSVNELQIISSSDEELEFSEDSSQEDEDGDDKEDETEASQQRTPGGGKRVTFQEPDNEEPKTVYVEVAAPKPPTAEMGLWTHEPRYDYSLNVKVYQPIGIQLDDVKCSLTLQQQFKKSEPFPEEKPSSRGKGTGKSPSPAKGNSLIGSKGGVANKQQKKKSMAKPGDRHFILTFPIGDKPLFDKILGGADPTPSVAKPHPPAAPASKPVDSEESEDETQSEKSPREEPIKLGVHHGQFDELVAMGTMVMEDLKALDVQLVESEEETKLFAPTPFPVYKIETGRKAKTHEEPSGVLPLVFYYTRVHKPFVKDKETESETLKEIVFDLTGVDLRVMKKEDLSLNKDYQDRCLSAMSVQSTHSEKEDVVPKADVEVLIAHHEEEIKIIQEDYENRIRELALALEQVQTEHLNTLLTQKPGEAGQGDSPLQGWNQENNNEEYTRLSDGTILTHVKKYKRPANIPKWGNDLPDDFLDRLQMFSDESQKRRQELTAKTRKEIEERTEKQLAVQYRLSLPTANRRTALKDVSLPAVFMPSRTGQLYNPRAHQYFHPTGSLGQLRLTQPPSIFQLPPLPNKSRLSVLNLFDIRTNFAWQEEGADPLSRATTMTPSRATSVQPPVTPNNHPKVAAHPAPPNTAD